MFSRLIHWSNNLFFLKVCYNHRVLKITIGINQSLSNNDLYEYKCLQKINKLYKHAGKYDNLQKFKYILEAAMISTPEVFTTNILDVKEKTAIRRFRAAKSKRKEIKSGTTPWSLKPKQKVN